MPNGKIIIDQYFHLQENTRLPVGTEVNSGDIIGYQGDSGNLKAAIAGGGVDSHVHIEVLAHDGSSNWNYFNNFNNVDPRNYLNTTINNDGTKEENTDCN